MPLPVPSLDDRRFDDLVSEVRAMIPSYCPAWTDHNPSDPGIVLVELFAFLIEAAFYQIDRVPERTLRRFAELTGTTSRPGEPVQAFLRRAVEAVRAVNRSVTSADSELVASSRGVFAVSPPLPRDLAAGVPVTALTPLPGTVALAEQTEAGSTSLRVTGPQPLHPGDLLLLRDRATGPASGGTAGSGTAGSGTAGSGTAGSGTAGSATAGSGTAGSATAGSGTAGSATAGSGTAGEDRTELARVHTVSVASAPAGPGRPAALITMVKLAESLKHGHAPGIEIVRLAGTATPAPTALAHPAPAGADTVIIEPVQGLSGGVLQLGTGDDAVCVRGQSVARTRVITQVVPAATVYPADQVIQVLVVPGGDQDGAQPWPALIQAVFEVLRDHSPITTRLRVTGPSYRGVRIAAMVVRDFPALLRKDTVQRAAEARLRRFLSPISGGDDGTGWQFGRAVYRSELYQVLQDTPGVDHVRELLLDGNATNAELPLAASAVDASASLVDLTGVTVTVVDT